MSEFAQKSVTCCAAAAVTAAAALLVSRFTAAVACPRALPINLLAPLSHMLMNGFFVVQGFFMWITRSGRVGPRVAEG